MMTRSAEDGTLYVQVANDIETEIFNTDIDKLPTELELAEQYCVSRTVVREALYVLKERGLVESKVGEGSFITKPDHKFLSKVFYRMIMHNNLKDSEVSEIRVILEGGAAFLASGNRTPEFIRELSDNLEEMRKVKDNLDLRIDTDIEFHQIIARQSRNPILIIFIESLNQVLAKYIKCRLIERPQGNEDGLLWHSFILSVMQSGTPRECEESMRSHLTNSFYQIESGKAMRYWLGYMLTGFNGKVTLSRKISNQIESDFLLGNSDVRLPTEFGLAENYGVSRTVIREALGLLRARGLVESKVGVGAFSTVDNFDVSNVFNRMNRSHRFLDSDLNNLRLILEKGAVALASSHVTEDFIEKLKTNVAEMKVVSADNIEMRIDVDIKFHHLIATQSENKMLLVFVQSITELTRAFIKRRLISRPESYLAGIQWHERLIEAFEDGGALGPETVMVAHLTDVYHIS